MSKYKKTKIYTFKCEKCGQNYTITQQGLKLRQNKKYPNLCPKCLKKYLNNLNKVPDFYELECEKCHKKYKISRINYNQRKRMNRPNYCQECAKQNGINIRKKNNVKKSKKEKEKLNRRISKSLKKYFADKKQPDIIELNCDSCYRKYTITRSAYKNRIKNNIPNLCPECMRIHSNKLIGESQIKLWNEKKLLKNQKAAKTKSINYQNKTNEEKKEYSNIRKESWNRKTELEKQEFIQKQQQIWNDKSQEEKEQQIHNLHDLTEIQELLRRSKISAKHKLRYENQEERDRTGKAVIEGLSRMSTEAKIKMRSTQLVNSKGKNQFHKDFENLFNTSELAKQFYFNCEIPISSNDIIHFWDYGIYNKHGDLELLLDLDGSYFHADQCDYNGYYSKEEYDEKRYLSIPNNIKSCIIYENKFDDCFNYLEKILKLSYDRFIKNKYEYFRNVEFPYPKYYNKELQSSFNDLLKMNCEDNHHINNLSLNTRLGDHYNDKLSPYDIWNDNKSLMNLIKSNALLHNHFNMNKIYQSFNLNSKIRFMSAGRAKLIINKYLNDYGIIFDPYDKYSNILLGTISSDKEYIGIFDEEIKFSESLQLLIFLRNDFKEYASNAKIYYNDYFINSNVLHYPCLFTSLYDNNNCDDMITRYIDRYKCNKYVFVVNNTEKYVNNIVEIIKNKNYYDEYIILIEK